ncbi:MAG: hypothetical protein IKQ61_08125 [Spirochaetales bacterium]|nr:hypothetical protein [Spirochaetales bacterium]
MSKRFLAVILMMILTISAFAQESDATSQSGKVLTDKEVKFKEKILDKNGIDPSNKEQMHKQFKKHLTAGIVQAAVSEALLIPLGSVFTVLTTLNILYDTIGYDDPYGNSRRWNGKLAWYRGPFFGNGSYILLPIAVSMLLVGLIIDPLSAIHFIRAGRTYSIYKKTTGQRLMSFIQRTSFGGGYDWESKEVNVTMAIKL